MSDSPQTSRNSTEVPIIRSDNVQGDSLAGFKKPFQLFLFLKINDVALCRKALRLIVDDVSTLNQVWLFNYSYRESKVRGKRVPSLKATWINLSLSWKGLTKLWPNAPELGGTAFIEGMRKRASRLGDVIDFNVNRWKFGADESSEPDMVLMIAADDLTDLFLKRDHYREVLGGFSEIWQELGARSSTNGRETFGFRDGISQPRIRAKLNLQGLPLIDLPESTEHDNSTFANLSEFLIGYEQSETSKSVFPGYNDCSFIVFRRYVLLEEEFRRFIANTFNRVASQYDVAPVFDEAYIASRFVGRWTNGTFVGGNIEGRYLDDVETSRLDIERFERLGTLECPHFSHILKANPRGILPVGEQRHILRRGIGFKTNERSQDGVGLMFVCYQSSIDKQFEFILRNWLSNPNFPTLGSGYDPIAGQNAIGLSRTRCITLQIPLRQGGFASYYTELPQDFVCLTGGCYAMVPSIELIAILSQ
ncbi:MAG TPA: hypothetical protein VF088_14760 [Pyrinomonadaceae bacterium]